MGDFDRNFNRGRSGKSRFDRNRSGRSGGRDRGGDRGRDRRSERHEMHKAICDKCGKDCEVPFKPTQGKPIYCDDCFKDKSREAGSRSEVGKQSNENLDQINKKLDKILNILGAAKEPVEDLPEFKKPKKEEKPKKIEEEQPDLEKPKKKAKKKKS